MDIISKGKRGKDHIRKMFVIVVFSLLILTCAGAVFGSDEASALEGVDAQGNCGIDGNNVRWCYQVSKSELTIYGTGEMCNYDNDAPPWNYTQIEGIGLIKTHVRFITIQEGVEKIGNLAFADCVNLEKVKIPASLSYAIGGSFPGYGLNHRPASELAGKTFESKQGIFFQNDMVALLITEPDDYGHGAVTVKLGDELLYGPIDGYNTGSAFYAAIGSTHYYAKSVPSGSEITVSGSKFGYTLTEPKANDTLIENGSFIITEDTTITYTMQPLDFILRVNGVENTYNLLNLHNALMSQITDEWGVEHLRYDGTVKKFFIGDREVEMDSAVTYDGLAFLINTHDYGENTISSAWVIFESEDNIFYKLRSIKASTAMPDDYFVYELFDFIFKGAEAPEGVNLSTTEDSGVKVHTISGTAMFMGAVEVKIDVVLSMDENEDTFMITGDVSATDTWMSFDVTFVQDQYVPIGSAVQMLMNGYYEAHSITSEPDLIKEEVRYDVFESGTRNPPWHADTSGATVTDLGIISYNTIRFGQVDCNAIQYEKTAGTNNTVIVKYFHEGKLVAMEEEITSGSTSKEIIHEYDQPDTIHSEIFGDIECEVVLKTEINRATGKSIFTKYYFYNGLVVREETYDSDWNLKFLGTLDDVAYLPFFAVDGYELLTKHTVTFKNHDGSVLQSGKVDYGATPEYRGTPTKESTAQHTYVFKGWDSAIKPVTGDVVYTAVFDDVINEYEVTFKNHDETVLQSETLAYGTVPEYTGATPTKESTAQHTYVFKGWDSAIGSVTGHVVYTATFEPKENVCKVSIYADGGEMDAPTGWDGSKGVFTRDFQFGTSWEEVFKTIDKTPVKEGHTFTGWDVQNKSVIGNDFAVALYTPNEGGGNEGTYREFIHVNTVTDVTKLFETAKDNNGDVKVLTNTSAGALTIVFDGDAVNAIAGKGVSLKANVIENSADIPDAKLVIEVTLDGATFSEGKAKVSVPFSETVPEGKQIKVYFINGDERKDMEATLVNGMVVFETNHFSTYAVVFEDASSPNNGGFPIWVIFVIIGVIAAAGAGAFFVIKQKKA